MLSYRIDKGRILADFADVAESGTVFGLWNGRGIPILKSLAGSSDLVIAAKPYNRRQTEAVFRLTGISEAVADVRRACGWQNNPPGEDPAGSSGVRSGRP